LLRQIPHTQFGLRTDANTFTTLANQDARSIRSDHLVAGSESHLNESARITVEGFYKKYADYPVSILDNVSLANKSGGFEVLRN